MLSYLTNDSNVKGAPNENYARELMELHTLGAGKGYTETDVKEVARCFTGWAFQGPTRRRRRWALPVRRGGSTTTARRASWGAPSRPAAASATASGCSRSSPATRTPPASSPRSCCATSGATSPSSRSSTRWPTSTCRPAATSRRCCAASCRRTESPPAQPKLKRPLHLMVSAMRALGGRARRTRATWSSRSSSPAICRSTGRRPTAIPTPRATGPAWSCRAGTSPPTFLARERSGVRTDLSLFDPARSVAKARRRRWTTVLFNGTMSDDDRRRADRLPPGRQGQQAPHPRRHRPGRRLARIPGVLIREPDAMSDHDCKGCKEYEGLTRRNFVGLTAGLAAAAGRSRLAAASRLRGQRELRAATSSSRSSCAAAPTP